MKKWLYNKILNFLTKPVTLQQIITVNDVGQVKIDGKVLTPQELLSLQQEIKAFQNFRLKTIMLNTPKALAEQRMFRDAKSWDDMLAGKLTLYVVDIQENIMNSIMLAPQGNQVVMQKNPYRK